MWRWLPWRLETCFKSCLAAVELRINGTSEIKASDERVSSVNRRHFSDLVHHR